MREKFNSKEQTFVIKVSTKLKDKILGGLGLIQSINKKKLEFEVVRVSGTLKGLEKE